MNFYPSAFGVSLDIPYFRSNKSICLLYMKNDCVKSTSVFHFSHFISQYKELSQYLYFCLLCSNSYGTSQDKRDY